MRRALINSLVPLSRQGDKGFYMETLVYLHSRHLTLAGGKNSILFFRSCIRDGIKSRVDM